MYFDFLSFLLLSWPLRFLKELLFDKFEEIFLWFREDWTFLLPPLEFFLLMDLNCMPGVSNFEDFEGDFFIPTRLGDSFWKFVDVMVALPVLGFLLLGFWAFFSAFGFFEALEWISLTEPILEPSFDFRVMV